jgi:hypothetical protein
LRHCSICGSDKTYVDPKGRERWSINHNTGIILCIKCASKEYRETHKEQRHKSIHKYNDRLVNFKGRQILVDSCPRTGQCSKCGRKVGIDGIKKTHIHHNEYHEDDVLKDTLELCVACHGEEHDRIRKLPGGDWYNRKCSICDSNKTYVNPNGYACWLTDKDTGLTICKRCSDRIYCQIHEDKIREQKRMYRIKNSDKISEGKRMYSVRNRDKIREQQRLYKIENPDKLFEYHHMYGIKNRDKISKRNQAYYIKNRDRIIQREQEYYVKNHNKINERLRARRIENTDRFRQYDRRSQETNHDKILERQRLYRARNRDKINERRRKQRLSEPASS